MFQNVFWINTNLSTRGRAYLQLLFFYENSNMDKSNNVFLEMDSAPNFNATPKMIFIVPYRDRQMQLDFFNRHMKYILEDMRKDDYRILIVHQRDNRSFNRGALKNIGFLIVRDLYPSSYKDITLIFNDLDTMPYTKNFLPYDTVPNTVKHFYGVPFTLGGIFSIKAHDFEKINGFPNFWAWGYEDNLINARVKNANMQIDRSVFYPMHDIHIIHLNDGTLRNVNKNEFTRYVKNTNEGWNSITQLKYTVHDDGMVDVYHFNTGIEETISTRQIYDLKNGTVPFNPPFKHKNPKMALTMLR